MKNYMNNIYIYVSALFILLISSCGCVNAATPFIIDTDVAVDDAIAILYLLQKPDVQVKAITIESTGNARCVPAFQNTLGLLKLVNRSNIPVDCGPAKTFAGHNTFPAAMRDEADMLSGVAKLLPPVSKQPDQKGIELLIDTIQKSKEPITILALGPLTNIAAALQRAPDIKNHIQAIYIMGGAVNVPGNCANKKAEWNIYIDPIAASIVFNQSIPIILVPLDATNTVTLDMDFYNQLKKNHRAPAANFVFALMKNNIKLLTEKQWYFVDPLTAAIASDESIATFKFQPLLVSLSPESQAGRTVIDTNAGQNIRIADTVDESKFKKLLLSVLNKK